MATLFNEVFDNEWQAIDRKTYVLAVSRRHGVNPAFYGVIQAEGFTEDEDSSILVSGLVWEHIAKVWADLPAPVLVVVKVDAAILCFEIDYQYPISPVFRDGHAYLKFDVADTVQTKDLH